MNNRATGPELVVLSEKKAITYQPAGREVCISVTDIDDTERPRLSPAFVSVLHVAFSDIDEPDPDPSFLLFSDVHATAIVGFVHQWRDADRIVIHCMAGQSRSPGIAMALCDLFGWQLGEMEEQFPWWNPWVRTELVRVGREVLQRARVQETSSPDGW